MSITVTYTTLDHRYFMRRTKGEIISHIEQMRGKIMERGEYLATLAMTKDQIADEAMKLARALPAPPDPVDAVVQAIRTEIERQCDAREADNSYCIPDRCGPDTMLIDGWIDLRALARAVLEGMPK